MKGLYVALDGSDLAWASSLASRLADVATGFKVGLELLMTNGPKAIDEIVDVGRPVFVDAKLHDIPNTVARAAAALARHGARFITVHASGGEAMVRAAAEATGRSPSGVLAVTVLTSLSPADLARVGVDRDTEAHVAGLATLAAGAGAEGIVCSPWEIETVRAVTPSLEVFTPGIRLEGGSSDDQRRVATPRRAVEAGADYLVVGRAITGARDPLAACRRVVEESGLGAT